MSVTHYASDPRVMEDLKAKIDAYLQRKELKEIPSPPPIEVYEEQLPYRLWPHCDFCLRTREGVLVPHQVTCAGHCYLGLGQICCECFEELGLSEVKRKNFICGWCGGPRKCVHPLPVMVPREEEKKKEKEPTPPRSSSSSWGLF